MQRSIPHGLTPLAYRTDITRRAFLLAMAALWLGVAVPARAEVPADMPTDSAAQAREYQTREYKVKAAYLYNFLNYITWPPQQTLVASQPAVFCVREDARMVRALQYIRRSRMNDRRIHLQTVQADADMRGCHVLFVGEGARVLEPENAAALLRMGVLVVADGPVTLDHAGVVMQRDRERIVVDIHRSRLTEAGFVVSSRLLRLARTVQ